MNGPQLRTTTLNGSAPTCGSHISAGRRIVASLVHTYGLFQLRSTDLNCTEPQVNGLERTCCRTRGSREHLGLLRDVDVDSVLKASKTHLSVNEWLNLVETGHP
ncbi:hypothetical protein KUTG_02382 [Kutzneria sp. 744]|nr:hypothetical protein KUTG_02382 [Kutzneria sp. 744]